MADNNNGRKGFGEKLSGLSFGDWLKIGGLIFAAVAAVITYYYGVKDAIAQNERNNAVILQEIAEIREDMTQIVKTGREQLLDIRAYVDKLASDARSDREEIDGRLSDAEKFAIRYDVADSQTQARLDRVTKQIEALDDYMRRSFPPSPSSVPPR